MKSFLILGSILLYFSQCIFAQSTDSTQVDSVAIYNSMKQKEAIAANKNTKAKPASIPFIKKIYFGGNIGMSFSYATSVRIEPLIGYRVNKFIHLGVKGYFQYTKYHNPDESYRDYGGSVFGQLHLLNIIYFQLEPEFMNYQVYGSSERKTVPFIWAGVGLKKKTGRRTWVTAQVLFDLLDANNSPYDRWEPRYSVGVGFGL